MGTFMTAGKFRKSALAASAALRTIALLGGGGAALMTALPVMAQDYTQVNATGRVTDESGVPVNGATVTVTSDDQGFSRTATTGSNGNYRVTSLPQGEYTFTVTAPNLATYEEAGISLTQSNAANSFQLAPAGTVASSQTNNSGDVIVVSGQRVRVSDFDRATVGAVINVADVADRVPVSRNLNAIVQLAPGVTAGDSAFGSNSGEGLPALAGGSVSENAYFLNGLNVTNFRTGLGAVEVPFVFYETVEVKNGGIPAEFGRFTGGFVNSITKSGSNELHGDAVVTWVPQGVASTAPNTLLAYNDADRSESVEAVFSLSGPIIKDRLFFYAFYQHNYRTSESISTSSNVGTADPYATGNTAFRRRADDPYYGGKLDFIPFDGQRLEFTYFDTSQSTRSNTYSVVDENGGSYDSRTDRSAEFGRRTSTLIAEYGGENYVGRYTGNFFDILTLSAAYGKSKQRDNVTTSQPNYPFISDSSGSFTPALTGNPVNLLNNNVDERTFYRADADLYVELLGEHHFKGGYDREELTSSALTSYTGNRAITYQNSGPTGDSFVAAPNVTYYSARTFLNGGEFNSLNEAFYLQDSWSLLDRRVTLNLGVRADKFTNDNVAGSTYYDSGFNFAPRLSFTADPFGDGTTKVFGSYGRYLLPVPSNTNIRLAGAETDYTVYYRLAGVNSDNTPIQGAPITGFQGAQTCPGSPTVDNCEFISDGTPTPTEATVSKNLKPQSVTEYVLGVERQLGNGLRASLSGIYRTLNESLEDVAIDAAVLNYCQDQNITGCDAIWDGFHQYVLVNPGKASTITLSDPINGETSLRTIDFTADQLGYPNAKREYWAVIAQVDRDFDGVWGLSGSYTYSSLRGNIEGGIRSDNGQTDSGLTTGFDQPGLTDGTYGYLPGHARHQIKLFGSYQLFELLNIGAQFQAISPRKFGCIGRVPANRDAFAGLYGAAGFYCNLDSNGAVITDPAFTGFQNNAAGTSLQLTPRGSQFESDWNIFLNLSAQLTIPSDQVNAYLRADVFNVFNRDGVTDRREVGTLGSGRPRSDYGFPLGYQSPRSLRLQLGVNF